MSRYIRNFRYRCVNCQSAVVYLNQGKRKDRLRDRKFREHNNMTPKVRCNECGHRTDKLMDMKLEQEINARVSNINVTSEV